MRQIVLDTETTGLATRDGHRLIEIGCIELEQRRPTGNNFHVYLNPDRTIDAEAVRIHGITQASLADKPRFADVVDGLLAYLDGAELIIHNADFDVGFLNHELTLAGRTDTIAQHCTILDTLPLAKRLHPGQKVSLDALCRRYGVDNSKRDLHGALLDAQLLADVYLLMTGGQSGLFQTEASQPQPQSSRSSVRQVQPHVARVQMASVEELQLHQAYLEGLAAKGTAVTWLADGKK